MPWLLHWGRNIQLRTMDPWATRDGFDPLEHRSSHHTTILYIGCTHCTDSPVERLVTPHRDLPGLASYAVLYRCPRVQYCPGSFVPHSTYHHLFVALVELISAKNWTFIVLSMYLVHSPVTSNLSNYLIASTKGKQAHSDYCQMLGDLGRREEGRTKCLADNLERLLAIGSYVLLEVMPES